MDPCTVCFILAFDSTLTEPIPPGDPQVPAEIILTPLPDPWDGCEDCDYTPQFKSPIIRQPDQYSDPLPPAGPTFIKPNRSDRCTICGMICFGFATQWCPSLRFA